MDFPALAKWTCLFSATRKRVITVTAIQADIEVLAIKGEPTEDDFGYWISDGESKEVPLQKYERLYARSRKSLSPNPTIQLDE